MKPPAELQLGPYHYEVVFNQAAFDRVQVEDKMDLCGRQKITDQKIWVNPKMGPDVTADTLIHECLHHFFRVSSLGPTVDGDLEESIVNFLAHDILAMLRDNPELVQWLCGE